MPAGNCKALVAAIVTTLFPLLNKGLSTRFPTVLETVKLDKFILPILAVVIVAFAKAEIYPPDITALAVLKFVVRPVVILDAVALRAVAYQLCTLPVVAVIFARAEI